MHVIIQVTNVTANIKIDHKHSALSYKRRILIALFCISCTHFFISNSIFELSLGLLTEKAKIRLIVASELLSQIDQKNRYI